MEQETPMNFEQLPAGSPVEVYFEYKSEAGWIRIGEPDEISLLRWTGIVTPKPTAVRLGNPREDSTVNVLPDDEVVRAAGFDNGHPLLLDRRQIRLQGERRNGEPFTELVRTVVRSRVASGQNA